MSGYRGRKRICHGRSQIDGRERHQHEAELKTDERDKRLGEGCAFRQEQAHDRDGANEQPNGQERLEHRDHEPEPTDRIAPERTVYPCEPNGRRGRGHKQERKGSEIGAKQHQRRAHLRAVPSVGGHWLGTWPVSKEVQERQDRPTDQHRRQPQPQKRRRSRGGHIIDACPDPREEATG